MSNLDAKLRVQTRAELADLQARFGVTTVYVTHDQVEAMTMGHRVVVLKDGIMQQVDTPGNLYRLPAHTFVAGFIGSPAVNLIPTTHSGDTVAFGSTSLPVDPKVAKQLSAADASEVTVGIRPQGLTLGETGEPAEIAVVEELGSEIFVFAELQHRGEPLRAESEADD